jgi:phage terminase Nu1 subunit (DNA packaging protein)
MSFADAGITERPSKTRIIGRTMLIDLDVPLVVQHDLPAVVRAHVDLAEIAIGMQADRDYAGRLHGVADPRRLGRVAGR